MSPLLWAVGLVLGLPCGKNLLLMLYGIALVFVPPELWWELPEEPFSTFSITPQGFSGSPGLHFISAAAPRGVQLLL